MINNMTIRRKAGIYAAVLVLMVFIVGVCLIGIVRAEPDDKDKDSDKDKSLTEQDFYQANDVNFYSKCDGGGSGSGDLSEDVVKEFEQKDCGKTHEQFIEAFGKTFVAIGKKLNLPWEGILAQKIAESGSCLAAGATPPELHNYYGIKANPSWKGPKELLPTPNDGVAESWFRKYPTVMDGLAANPIFIIKNSRYKEALKQKTDPEKYLSIIADAGYAESGTYKTLTTSILKDQILPAAKKFNLPLSSEMEFGPEINPDELCDDGSCFLFSDGINDGSCKDDGNFGSIAEAAKEMASWCTKETPTCYRNNHASSASVLDEKIKAKFQTESSAADCSEFVMAAVYKATGYFLNVMAGTICDSPGYKQIDKSEVKPGDFQTTSEHVEIITEVNNGEITATVGSHGSPGKGCGYVNDGICRGPSKSFGAAKYMLKDPTLRFCRYVGVNK